MVFLSARSAPGPATTNEIAEAEGITQNYVEQILARLKAAGLVSSIRGAHGGFLPARDAEEVTVADVVSAADEPLSIIPCLDEPCDRISQCVTRPVWQRANDALVQVLSDTTIAELVTNASELKSKQTVNYTI
jgi:Rrf2 family protein